MPKKLKPAHVRPCWTHQMAQLNPRITADVTLAYEFDGI
jgi:hypothetical protein